MGIKRLARALRGPQSVAALWGFAEATFFFLVPDIYLTRQAIRGLVPALRATLAALAGAAVGGLVMYVLAQAGFAAMCRFLDFIPAISPAMVAAAGKDVAAMGFLKAAVTGALTGVPYKIYAVWAGHLNVPVLWFVTASLLARAARFVSVVFLSWGLAHILSRRLSRSQLYIVHAVLWVIFYIGYFVVFGGLFALY